MLEISKSEIELFLTTTQFKPKPSHSAVSYPILTRILNRLQQNKRFSSIKINNNVIIDCRHRFVCLSYLNLPIELTQSSKNPSALNIEWGSILVNPIDYDSKSDRIYYSKLFDS
jgi:hypothetical protein